MKMSESPKLVCWNPDAVDREIDRGGGACHPRRAIALIDRDRYAGVAAGSPEIRCISQQRIDDKRTTGIIGAQLEPNGFLPLENVSPFNRAPITVDNLINEWCLLNDMTCPGMYQQVPRPVEGEFSRPIYFELNSRRVSIRSDLEVVFEASLSAAEHQADTRIDLGNSHRSKTGDVGVPFFGVTPDKVAAFAREPIDAGKFWVWIGILKPNSDGGKMPMRRSLAQLQHGFGRGKKERITAPPSDELHLRIGLAPVLLEA